MGEKVVAREYKVMLRAEQFAGDESKLLDAANEFWRAFTLNASAIVHAYSLHSSHAASATFEMTSGAYRIVGL
jgi:hypothetical protein